MISKLSMSNTLAGRRHPHGPLLLARVRLITLCEVRNTAGPSHHDLVNGSDEIDQIRRSELRLSLPFGLVRQPLAKRRGKFVVVDTRTSPGKGFALATLSRLSAIRRPRRW